MRVSSPMRPAFPMPLLDGLRTRQAEGPATLMDAPAARQGRKGCAVRSTVSWGFPAGISGSHPIGSSTSTASSSSKTQPSR